jgi:ATP-dependent Clp protease ATP-binding subunit ClpC
MSKSRPNITEAEIRRVCRPLLREAESEAARLKHNYIGTEHLFNGMTRLSNGVTVRMLIESGLDVGYVRNAIRREVGMGDDLLSEVLAFTPRAYRLLVQAVYLADDLQTEEVTEDQLLLCLLQEGEGVAVRKLIEMNVDIPYWVNWLSEHLQVDEAENLNLDFIFSDRDVFDNPFQDDYEDFGLTEEEQDLLANMPTPLLDKYGRDLTEQARLGTIHEAIGREIEIRAVARTLTRSKKNNPLLVGDAGVGKTAVVEGLAWQIAHDKAPKTLTAKRIIQIEIGSLVAGTSLRGQFEERLVGIVEEARNAADVILFIDEIHTIVGAGDTIDSNLDAANILKPALARGEISCIGATTFEEYRKAIAKDPALDRRFRVVDIKEPSEADTLTILERVYPRYEDHHKVKIEAGARKAAVTLSGSFLPDRRWPDKALDLLDEACARVVISSQGPEDEGGKTIDAETIMEVLSEWTGIPVTEISADERHRLTRMNQRIGEKIIGQPEAVRAVTETIITHRSGLGNPRRPVGVFLFVGPSGVGKTALAQTIADLLFGDENALIRLDMSEFYDEHTAARLIGAPPGYKGNERGGQLTEALRRKPYSVVLLDEIEKATPQVFDLFLQVFDEGRLTDAIGATVDCRHSIWIMTSNVGLEAIGKNYGFMAKGDDLPDYSEHLKKNFRLEFLNRLDEVVVFRPLSDEALDKILEVQLAELTERLDAKDLSLHLSKEARALILKEGASITEGARPLRRALERQLMRPLSAALLEDRFGPGDTVQVIAQDDKLVLRKKRGT